LVICAYSDCGGGYAKIMSKPFDQIKFDGETNYNFMFGPDVCGYESAKTHVIVNYNETNHLITKTVPAEKDQMTRKLKLI
jgi:calreticulin